MPYNSNMSALFLDIYFVIFKSLQSSVCKLKTSCRGLVWMSALRNSQQWQTHITNSGRFIPLSSVAVVVWFIKYSSISVLYNLLPPPLLTLGWNQTLNFKKLILKLGVWHKNVTTSATFIDVTGFIALSMEQKTDNFCYVCRPVVLLDFRTVDSYFRWISFKTNDVFRILGAKETMEHTSAG
jgi:hypothetical protein